MLSIIPKHIYLHFLDIQSTYCGSILLKVIAASSIDDFLQKFKEIRKNSNIFFCLEFPYNLYKQDPKQKNYFFCFILSCVVHQKLSYLNENQFTGVILAITFISTILSSV